MIEELPLTEKMPVYRWRLMPAFFMLATFMSWNVSYLAAEPLSSLPQLLSADHAATLPKETLATSADCFQLLEEHGFLLDSVRTSRRVPQIFAVNLPADLSSLPVAEKTSLFIRLLLPHVVKVNSVILQVRKELLYLVGKLNAGEKLTASEKEWLDDIATHYSGDTGNLDDLLSRVDIIPNALVLAQAIDESGWGTSHFAVAGNALYGEHLPVRGKAEFMSTPDGNARVEAFDSIYESTVDYVHNLNTTRVYGELREQRKRLRQNKKNLDGHELAGALSSYSALGKKYDHILKSIMTRYRLDDYDNASLADAASGLQMEFARK